MAELKASRVFSDTGDTEYGDPMATLRALPLLALMILLMFVMPGGIASGIRQLRSRLYVVEPAPGLPGFVLAAGDVQQARHERGVGGVGDHHRAVDGRTAADRDAGAGVGERWLWRRLRRGQQREGGSDQQGLHRRGLSGPGTAPW